MTDEIISIRIDKTIRQKMKMHEHINWSALIRKSLVAEIQKMHLVEKNRAERAARDMDALRKIISNQNKQSGVEIIREWRKKRK